MMRAWRVIALGLTMAMAIGSAADARGEVIPTALPAGVDLDQFTFDPLEGDVAPAAYPGRVFYVAQADPRATDTNPGTREQPWKTLARGVQHLEAGDTLCIGAGIYREEVRVAAVDDRDHKKPITIRNVPGERVSIRGSEVLKGFTAVAGTVGRWEADLGNLYLPPASAPLWKYDRPGGLNKRRELVALDNKRLEQVLTAADLKPNAFCVDDTTRRLVLQLPEGIDPNRQTVEVAVRASCLTVLGRGVRLHGLDFRHAAGEYQDSAVAMWGEYHVVERCRFDDSAFDGLLLKGRRHRAIRCIASGNGQTGISASVIQSELDGNITDGNAWRIHEWAAGGVKASGAAPQHVRVVNHLARRNQGVGIWFDFGCKFDTIENCYIADNWYSGIFLEASYGPFYVLNNVIIRNQGPISRYKEWGSGVMMNCTSDVHLYNNTIGYNLDAGVKLTIADHRTIDYEAGGTTRNERLRVRNNVFLHNGKAAIMIQGESAKYVKTHQLDHNLYFEADKPVQVGDRALSLTEWQTEFGKDADSIAADPQFDVSQPGRLVPPPASPVIGRGVSLKDALSALHRPIVDLYGRPRDVQKTDLGAVPAP